MTTDIKKAAENFFKLEKGIFDKCHIEIFINGIDPGCKYIKDYGEKVKSFFYESRRTIKYGKVVKNKINYYFVAVNTPNKDRYGKKLYVFTTVHKTPIVIGWAEFKEEVDDAFGFIHDKNLKKIFTALAFKL